jgi:DNA-binding MarR family transcriptional regulator
MWLWFKQMKSRPYGDSTISLVAEADGGSPLLERPVGTAPIELPQERYDLRILQSIRRIIRSAGLYSHKLAAHHGVTVPQLVCLLKIGEKAPITIKGLSRELYLSPSTLVGVVDRLEMKGLVERRRSKEDRRQVLIALTTAGQELILRTPSPLQDSLARSVTRLPESERIALASALDKIVDLMEIGDIDASPILETEPLLDGQEDELLRYPQVEI